MYALNEAQKNYDYLLPINNFLSDLEQDIIEKRAEEIIEKEFDDLAVFINDNGDADIYDKHFKAMLIGEDEAKEKANAFIFEQAAKMAKERLDKVNK
ncbi:hypothetical protein RCS94_06600 [Orbaceae bacterium ac157xtp]